ncbi:unnamed protein product [Musa hybrid cultivar]
MDGWWSFSFQGTRTKPDFVSDRRWGKPIHSRPPSSKAAPTIFSFLLLVTQKLHHAAASACHERRLGCLHSLSLSLSLPLSLCMKREKAIAMGTGWAIVVGFRTQCTIFC